MSRPTAQRRYDVVRAVDADTLAQIKALRGICFGVAEDIDAYDEGAIHLVVREHGSSTVICAFRLKLFAGGDLSHSYSAGYYGLGALHRFSGPLAELGRFCIHPDRHDPDILRSAWAALAGYVDRHQVQMLFGCSSFAGTDPEPYFDSFALLHHRHRAPAQWLPQVRAGRVVAFSDLPKTRDPRRGFAHMPPLLRSYLMMGAWVSDHAVVDRQMNTLHVFTGLEIAAIPESRKRALRALVQEAGGETLQNFSR